MTHNDRDTELYNKAEELIEQKPAFAEGETYGKVTASEAEEISSDSVDTFNQADELIEQKPAFAEGETYGEQPLPDNTGASSSHQPAPHNVVRETEEAPIFSDDEPDEDAVPEDHEHDHPAEHIGLMPLNRINHPLR